MAPCLDDRFSSPLGKGRSTKILWRPLNVPRGTFRVPLLAALFDLQVFHVEHFNRCVQRIRSPFVEMLSTFGATALVSIAIPNLVVH